MESLSELPEVAIRPMQDGEEREVYQLIRRICDAELQRDGRLPSESLAYIQPDAIRFRQQRGSLVLLALDRHAIIGVIEVEGLSHIALLFVARSHRGRGISRRLWDAARRFCLEASAGPIRFSVNSLASALPVYRRFGFVPCGPRQVKSGLELTPMSMLAPE